MIDVTQVRRKLRCYRLKQNKRGKPLIKFLMGSGVVERDARHTGSSGKGWWRLSCSPALHKALNNVWFTNAGLVNLKNRGAQLNA